VESQVRDALVEIRDPVGYWEHWNRNDPKRNPFALSGPSGEENINSSRI